MDARVIAIKCRGSRMAPLASLEVIQGELKELSEANAAKLRWRIEHLGFDAPLFVWQDKILDGTQRYRILNAMLADGWVLEGGLVPVCDIVAADLEEAKSRLLGYVSQYGTLSDQGLYEFLNGLPDPHLDSLDLPGFNLNAFRIGWLDDETVASPVAPALHPEIGRDEVTEDEIEQTGARLEQPRASGRPKIPVTCPKCQAEFLVEKTKP